MNALLTTTELPNGWRKLRVQAPELAMTLLPGQWLTLNATPWPVLRADAQQGWVDCLWRAAPPTGERLIVSGPLGAGFELAGATPRALLLGDTEGLAQCSFLADRLRHHQPRVKPLLLLRASPTFPFRPQPSRLMVPGLPSRAIAAVPLLDDWGIPSRLASDAGQPGCFDGQLEDLARAWLDTLQGTADLTVFACGGNGVREAAQRLARDYRLGLQALAGRPEPV